MTKPDGWEWLNELPDQWRPPQELEVPTSDPGANLAILDSDHQHAVYDAWTSRSGLAEALQEAVRALATARGAEPQ